LVYEFWYIGILVAGKPISPVKVLPKMARTSPIPGREREIGRRLLQTRKDLLVSRSSFAIKLSIGAERLASYEFGRVPLPWSVGRDVCSIFGVSQIWLGTGTGDKWHGSIHVEEAVIEPLGSRPLFSTVVDEVILPLLSGDELDPKFGRALRDIQASEPEPEDPDRLRKAVPQGPFLSRAQSMTELLISQFHLRKVLSQIPDDRLEEFADRLLKTANEMVREFRQKRR
jgi:hypothetical protein